MNQQPQNPPEGGITNHPKRFVMLIRITCVALCYFFLTTTVAQAEGLTDYQKANDLYIKQNYDSAIAVYEQLVAGNGASAEVHYNLGNCYYKKGDVARSILNYERALLLSPGDEDAEFNLNVARLKTVDKIEPVPQIFYKQWAESLASLLPTPVWSRLTLILFWLACFCFGIYLISSPSRTKRLLFFSGTFILLLSLSSWLMAGQSYRNKEAANNAIIMSASVYVKSSPDEKGNDAFILHEGAKVKLLDDYNEWRKVRIDNGSIGWLKSADVETI